MVMALLLVYKFAIVIQVGGQFAYCRIPQPKEEALTLNSKP